MGFMKSVVRWGILGTGRIADKFAEELPFSETGRLAAVASRTAEGARAFAARYGGVRAHGGYGSLLADPEVDAVYISTPHPFHAEWARAASLVTVPRRPVWTLARALTTTTTTTATTMPTPTTGPRRRPPR